MKNKRKLSKIFASVLILILAVALTGCGSSTSNNGSDGKGKVTITTSMWDPSATEKPSYVKAFEKKYPNINVKMIQIPDTNYSQKIHSMLAAGNAPDIILSWEADIQNFANEGVIDPLDDYIKKSDAFKMDDLIPAAQNFKVDGKTYGLPWSYATEVLYYNKDMFDKAGVDYPNANWTWQDFENAAKKLTIRKNGKTVQWGADAITIPGIWYSTIGAAGDDVIGQDGKLALGDGLRKTLEFQNKLTNVDKVSPQPSAGGEVADLFAAKKAAMTRQGSWYILSYKEADFNWDIAPLPKDERSYATLHTGFYTINSKSKHKDADWKFINFMMSEEGQKLIEQATNNPSTEMSVAAKGDWQSPGKNGPKNWDAMTESAKNGHFGYVLLNPTVTSDLQKDFDAVLLGQKSIDDVLNKDVPKAQKTLNNQ